MAAFVADMQQVGVHGIGSAALSVFHFDFDTGIFGIFQQFFTGKQIPFTPRSDDLDVRHQGIGTQFETDLDRCLCR